MEDLDRKLFAQLDDDFPAVRMQALDSLRERLNKAGSSFRDLVQEIESAIGAMQKLAALEKDYEQAVQHNAAWQQRDQQHEQLIAELSRKLAACQRQLGAFKAATWLRVKWQPIAAVGAALAIACAGYWWFPILTWPAEANDGLRWLADHNRSGGWFERPFVSKIEGKVYWVLLRGETDSRSFMDRQGNPVEMLCIHVYAVPAEADSGQYRESNPYNWFGGVRWPERVVQCKPTANQKQASR